MDVVYGILDARENWVKGRGVKNRCEEEDRCDEDKCGEVRWVR